MPTEPQALEDNQLFGQKLVNQPDLPSSASPALRFQVQAQDGAQARAAQMELPHFVCETPMFMPVGTKGTVKGMTSDMLKDCNVHLILGNTYHLGIQPGADIVDAMGGLHEFISWDRAMLTDSDITEQGVEFQSPVDGSRMLLTPEHSIKIQNQLGADIIMALDDVVSSVHVDDARFAEATDRTTRWIDRCIAAHSKPQEQNLFAIVQGGLNAELRQRSVRDLVARDTPGYAIGGLAGGEDKDSFWRVVAACAPALPAGKPRYVMGIGYPVDVVVCTALGADMYDSVFPTRTARFGVALVDGPNGDLRLKKKMYEDDTRPIAADCSCAACKHYSRAALHAAIILNLPAACTLISAHNITYMQNLTLRMRRAICSGTFNDFVQHFVLQQYPSKDYPQWLVDALAHVQISLL